jgi:6-phosphogluconate dehydrogenase (decarboxylating)
MATTDFGMVGLGRMGANIVRRLARHTVNVDTFIVLVIRLVSHPIREAIHISKSLFVRSVCFSST